ncbi:tRNA pseudouridine(38-40) synthase TruA [Nocardioides insulae]|uniref:tRNA pseudouridine(38-40) synthase TruA n=1 Tax=Nocardioides insulae TaxID=394734 RepID=UPI0003FDE64D|nr:tRNA pseudouridine(38-40) synthase TruA [Nocardioides insulae]
MRIRIDLAYDGSDFHGWATQPKLRTVQGTLEAALATALRVPEQRVVCAGRTDTGVHARGQVIHLDVEPDDLVASAGRSPHPPLEALVRRLNGILPTDIRIRSAVEAAPGFDARFSALERRYVYRVADRPGSLDPLRRTHVIPWPRPLDLSAMNVASSDLLGLHDFASFCRPREGATTIRTLARFTWARDSGGVAEATVVADAFCHSMVRALVGCLLTVGEGRRDPAWAGRVLHAGRRDQGVSVAPAAGLTLEEVAYPPDEGLLRRAEQTRARRPTHGATATADSTQEDLA